MNGFDKDETVRLLSKAWQEYLTRDNYHPLDEYELDRDGVSEWTDEAVREFASHAALDVPDWVSLDFRLRASRSKMGRRSDANGKWHATEHNSYVPRQAEW